MKTLIMRMRLMLIVAGLFGSFVVPAALIAQEKANEEPKSEEKKPDFPPLAKVTEGYTEVTAPDGKDGFYKLWFREKDQQMLAELPKDFADQRHFIALTVSSGTIFAGLQSDDFYVHWRRFNDRLALIQDNLDIRSTGDDESKDSVKRLFTDTVLLDIPILTVVDRGGPVIDLDDLLVKQASVFFGGIAATKQPFLATFAKKKAFPENVELAVEFPCSDGVIRQFHYSFSNIKENKDFKKRLADTRVGYFTTSFSDYGQYDDEDVRTRYINRWHLEKRDPSLKLSPPKTPIVFYLEHTTPVRYRRWVREGVLYWNKAFEQVGILNAIEVQEQDKTTGLNMDKDPEDVRYNFIRWLNNDVSTAIGPSRVDPRTGEILDADIVLTDGWIRTFDSKFENEMPKIAMEGLSHETIAWLADHPDWDPRLRLAAPDQRDYIRQQILRETERTYVNENVSTTTTRMLGDEVLDGLVGRTSQVNGSCMAADGRAFDVATMRMMIGMKRQEAGDDKKEGEEEKKEDENAEQLLDGMPESFIGPLLADLVCHEVGHTLGLRHNFKASSIYSLAELNSEELKGQKPFAGSVMDYLPVNFNFESGKVQGDYAMIGVGPYDMWAIEYGYELDEKKLPKILERVAEPELVYATDEDTGGPDPLAQRYDFSEDPLDYAFNQVRLAKHHRDRILQDFVKEGDSWARARRGYELTLRMQTSSIGMMSQWIGGTFVNRDKKGDPNGRPPIVVVPVEQQRKALNFILENTFDDDVFGLTPELLSHMSVDKWTDSGRFGGMDNEPTWPVHDRVMGVQASALTQLMNPTRLRRVYDNEFRVPPDEDALTLPELMNTITNSIWSELQSESREATDRNPLITSLRRNLQTEHLERLFDLASEQGSSTTAMKPIGNLAAMTLKELNDKIGAMLGSGDQLDSYTKAHLQDASDRIRRWADSKIVVQAAESAPISVRGSSDDE